jgi:molybdate transport system ATP-binding protein
VSAMRLELRLRLPLAHFELALDVESDARCLGVFGPSGAGKTSLLEALAGWRTPRAGRLRIGDALLFDAAAGVSLPIERRGAGYVPQDALLLPHWSVGRNVRAGAERGGDPAATAELVRGTCALLEIGHLLERSTTQLSGGERQRVALARALVSRPSFLLLDEPLGALDLALRRRILPYLIRVRERFGLPTVFVSHDATEVQALCDEVLVLEEGRVRARGAPGEVLRRASPREEAFENVLGGRVSELREGTALVQLDGGGLVRVPGAGLESGERAVFALGSDEILIALDTPTRISARNVLPARVERLEPAREGEVHVDVRLDDGRGARLAVSLTHASAQELELRAGLAVVLVFKTQSSRVLSSLRPSAARDGA